MKVKVKVKVKARVVETAADILARRDVAGRQRPISLTQTYAQQKQQEEAEPLAMCREENCGEMCEVPCHKCGQLHFCVQHLLPSGGGVVCPTCQ